MSKKKVYLLAALAMVIATVVEIFLAHPHHHNWWDTMPGFDVLFGMVGCAVLIIVAKKIVGPLIQKREDYYEGGEDE